MLFGCSQTPESNLKGFFPIKEYGKWGYISKDGKVAIPPEFKTAAQICKMWGYTQQHASKVLNAMVKNGSAEMRKFAVPVDTINKNKFGPRRSYCRRTPFYKIAPSKSPKS